jgi:hypothetical protein
VAQASKLVVTTGIAARMARQKQSAARAKERGMSWLGFPNRSLYLYPPGVVADTQARPGRNGRLRSWASHGPGRRHGLRPAHEAQEPVFTVLFLFVFS